MALGLAEMVARWRSLAADAKDFLPGDAASRLPGGPRSMGRPEPGDPTWAAVYGTAERPVLPALAADPRLIPLRRAGETWRLAAGPRRTVVDQVCLVPDVPSFFEAIAAWDDEHWFPILIDEPARVLPFLRAFRPARVVRYRSTSRRPDGASIDGAGSGPGPANRPSAESERLARWMEAMQAVVRAWTPPSVTDDRLPPAGVPPRGLGRTPPGVVLTSPDSPMLAGAVALAAGRFQPIVRVEPGLWNLDGDGSNGSSRHGEVLSLEAAWRFARRIESGVAAAVPRYDGLGDDCDFLTIAGDWPYRYDNDSEGGVRRGILAVDDLVGRVLEGEPDAGCLERARTRWAFTGRLTGDPASSVYRAMGAMFLAPGGTLLWDTYRPELPWSAYSLFPVARRLARPGLAVGPFVLAGGGQATLAGWQRIMDPANRFGMIWLNSTGSPTDFSIAGGPGRPADIPGGCPAAVVMIQSFSAADPTNPGTIAGRWLEQGAYVYFGSVNEPYLVSFRIPGLVAELAAEGMPLSAALRQGESEPFGRPWRLVYLGDPLYRLPTSGPDRIRLNPDAWRRQDPAYSAWPAVEVIKPAGPPPPGEDGASADRRLDWCLAAAILEAARAGPDRQAWPLAPSLAETSWPKILASIPRDRLEPRRRAILDTLLIDALGRSGDWDELLSRLARTPAADLTRLDWIAIETATMQRLARVARDSDTSRGFTRALDLWDEAVRRPWPAGSDFPEWITRRLASLAEAEADADARSGANRRLPAWRDRVRRADDEMAGNRTRSPHALVVAAERARLEARHKGPE